MRKPRGRLFWLAILGYALLLSVSGWQIHATLAAELEMHGGQANRQFTRMFANDNWEELRALLRLGATAEEAKANPNLDEITSVVRRFAAGTELVGVKIFNAQGLLLYATDSKLIGSDKSRSEGFLKAIRGVPATELIHRDVVSGFDGEIHDRDLVASYVPIQRNAMVEAVVEVYSDRTHAISAANVVAARLIGIIAVLAALSLLPWLSYSRMLLREQRNSEAARQSLAQQLAVKVDECTRGSRETTRFLALVADHLERPAREGLEVMRSQTATDAPAGVAEARLETIARRAAQLRRLSQVEFGQLSGRSLRFELGPILTRFGAEAAARAEQVEAKSLLHVAASIGGTCEGDPELIEETLQILVQLTTRRLRAGDTLQLRAQVEAQGVTIDLLDTGRPLDAHQLGLLRGEPSRGAGDSESSETTPREPDEEIGLRLTAGLVRVMRGRVSVHSGTERGTSVSLWLPLQPTGQTSVAGPANTADPAGNPQA